jgi:hypothetical protein
MNIKQVIIWGHKLHSHTHSYIHNGFYIAFKHLGYDTFWYDDNDNVSTHDFSCSLFITEHQVNKKIPCRNDCIYISHYVDPRDYRGVPKENIIILKNSPRDFNECDKNKGYVYQSLNYGIPHEYFSLCDNYKCLYMYWATDLLPEEINENINKLSSITTTDKINFVGTFSPSWRKLKTICDSYKLPFYNYGGTFNVNSHANKSINENIQLIQTSLISPALQDETQLRLNYIPCRIFKNISYGKMGMTNSLVVYELFNKNILFHTDIHELFKMGVHFEQRADKNSIIQPLMEFVRDNHTYLNRIHTIKQFLNDYTSFRLGELVVPQMSRFA